MVIDAAFLLYILAFVCFLLAAIGVSSRANLIAVGLALTTLAVLLGRLPRGVP